MAAQGTDSEEKKDKTCSFAKTTLYAYARASLGLDLAICLGVTREG